MKKKIIVPIVLSSVALLLGGLIYLGISSFPELLESEKSINSLRKIMDEGDELRKFIRPKEAIRIYSLSRAFIEEIARESGAMYKC